MPYDQPVTSAPKLGGVQRVWNVVSDYSAKGDGVADDYTALQTAINDCYNTGGGIVYIPAGTYKCNTGLTFPTTNPVSGYYETPITLVGEGPSATIIKKGADVILLDASGTISAGVATMRRAINLQEICLDGASTGTQPLLRCYYNLDSQYRTAWFRHNNGPLIWGVQWWDSYFYGCWIDNARGTTLSLDPGWNSGVGIWGHEGVILTSLGGTGLGTSTMGYSTDNVNNIWFVNCNFTENAPGSMYIGQMGGSSLPNRIYLVNTKFESMVGGVGPPLRIYGGTHIGVSHSNFIISALGAGIGSVDTINLANVTDISIQDVNFEEASGGAYTTARGVLVAGGCDSVFLDNIYSTLNTGGTGTVPTGVTASVYGQYTTASGQYGTPALVEFAGSPTNIHLGRIRGSGTALKYRGTPASYTHKAVGGTSTQTPGAVSSVTIAHGMSITPNSVSIEPGDANARGAPASHVTFDGTNITLTFASNLSAATAYTWRWLAC